MQDRQFFKSMQCMAMLICTHSWTVATALVPEDSWAHWANEAFMFSEGPKDKRLIATLAHLSQSSPLSDHLREPRVRGEADEEQRQSNPGDLEGLTATHPEPSPRPPAGMTLSRGKWCVNARTYVEDTVICWCQRSDKLFHSFPSELIVWQLFGGFLEGKILHGQSSLALSQVWLSYFTMSSNFFVKQKGFKEWVLKIPSNIIGKNRCAQENRLPALQVKTICNDYINEANWW